MPSTSGSRRKSLSDPSGHPEPRWVRAIETVTHVAAIAVGVLILTMLVLIVADVVMRNLLNQPIGGVLGVVTYLLMPSIGILGLGYVHLRNEEIVMTLIAEEAGARTRTIVGVGVEALVLGTAVYLLCLAVPTAAHHIEVGTADPIYAWIPYWPARIIVVVGLAVLVLAVPARLYRLTRGTEPAPNDVESEVLG